jgi:hypothetical protein
MAYAMWEETLKVLDQHKITEWELEVTASTAEDVGGTLDVVGTDGKGTALLLDYKTGMGVQVEAVNNKQILFAAANLLYGESGAKDLVEGCHRFVGVIMQPDRSGEIGLKEWEFDRDLLDLWWEKHQCNIALARDGIGNLEAGEHCKFCPANGLCDATTGRLLKMKQIDPEDAEQLAWALDNLKDVEDTIAAVKKLAFEQLEIGMEIPGWKLVQGRAGNLTWDDEETALKEMKKALRAVKDENGKRALPLTQIKESIVTSKVITPTQAKSLLKKFKAKDDFVEEIANRPPPTKPVLAPADDPREAVLSSAAFAAALNSIK